MEKLTVVCLSTLAAVVMGAARVSAADFSLEDCGIAQPANGMGLGLGPAEELSFPLSAAPCLDCEESVTYTSFAGTDYTLTRYQGAFVEVLIPDSWILGNVLSTEKRRLLIERADYLYAHAAELIRGEPAGSGKLTIAFIESTCGLGCGRVGSKGIEVLSTQPGIDHVLRGLDAGLIPGVVSHEMMHNFDVYNAHLFSSESNADGHAWTAFVGPYLDLFARMGTPSDDPEDSMSEWIVETLDPYLADPSATWLSCVSTGDCPEGIEGHLAWAGISNRFAELHGPTVVQDFFLGLEAHTAVNAPAGTLQGKADLHIEMMAEATNQDLRCYVDYWKWSISPALESQLAMLPAAPFCIDEDLDGFSRLEDDCDEGDGQAYPGAPEVLNGIDDNCSGVIDDLEYVEPVGGDFISNGLVALPSRIQGVIDAEDHDDFTLDVPAPMNVEVELCSTGFQGFLFVLIEGDVWLDNQYVFANECSTKIYALDEARIWRFDVAINVASLPGGYQVRVGAAPEWPLASAWGDPDLVTEAVFPVTLGTQSIPSNPAGPPTEARFWVSGIGWTESVPYAGSATVPFFPWPYGAGEYAYRVQLLSSGVPATDWSSEVRFVPEPGRATLLTSGMLGLVCAYLRRRAISFRDQS